MSFRLVPKSVPLNDLERYFIVHAAFVRIKQMMMMMMMSGKPRSVYLCLVNLCSDT